MSNVDLLISNLANQIDHALAPMRLSLGRLASFELSRRPMTAARLHRIELLQDVREGVDLVERIVRQLHTLSQTDDEIRRRVEIPDLLENVLAIAGDVSHPCAWVSRQYERVPSVCVRPTTLLRAFENVVENAVEAIARDPRPGQLRVATRTDARGYAVIEISDSGPGIAEDELPRVFDPFFTTHPRRALGLGLAMTRDMVHAEGGEVEVDSEIGKGTTVRICLPPCPPAAIEEHTPTEDSTRSEPPLRILIVDDDRPVTAAIALELGDHDVVVTESGREAIQALHEDSEFDVVVCDVARPEGRDLYEEIRKAEPHLLDRLVLLGEDRTGNLPPNLDAPVIAKPIESDQLHAVVEAIASDQP